MKQVELYNYVCALLRDRGYQAVVIKEFSAVGSIALAAPAIRTNAPPMMIGALIADVWFANTKARNWERMLLHNAWHQGNGQTIYY